MGKKKASKRKTLVEEKETHSVSPDEEKDHVTKPLDAGVARRAEYSSDDDYLSSEEDDDLVLEGVLVRNPDAPPSSSDEEVESVVSSESEYDEKPPSKAAAPRSDGKPKASNHGKRKTDSKQNCEKKKAMKSDSDEPEVVNVDFTFCDMNDKFFHGIKTHLLSSSTIYASQSSALADAIIENVSVGTVISTEGDNEGNVYGFASVLPVKTEAICVTQLKEQCLKHCPAHHKEELETVLSGRTRRPAGFILHGRMINLPLEIVEVLHQQLVLDIDWAVENAEGGAEERKSLDFGAFVRLAPAYPAAQGDKVVYKYFDDEVLSSNAEFVYNFDAPKTFATEEKQICSVIVMTKTGHRQSMKDLEKLVHST